MTDITGSDLVWYVTYGSNMLRRRLGYYLEGGTPEGGGNRTYLGCRDKTPPRADQPIALGGCVYFACESRAWTGGLALYDPDVRFLTAEMRAWLITREQFGDIATQEMYGEVHTDLDLAPVFRSPLHKHLYGQGRYETIYHLGNDEGYPLLTLTAHWGALDIPERAPAAAYLQMIGAGLLESRPDWDPRRVAAYLSDLHGVRGAWSEAQILDLLVEETPQAATG